MSDGEVASLGALTPELPHCGWAATALAQSIAQLPLAIKSTGGRGLESLVAASTSLLHTFCSSTSWFERHKH